MLTPGFKTSHKYIFIQTLKTANSHFPPETCITHPHNLPRQWPLLKPPCALGPSVGSPSHVGSLVPCRVPRPCSCWVFIPTVPIVKKAKNLPKLRILSLISTLRAFMASGALAPSQLLCSGPSDTHCAWKLLVCSKALHSGVH